jgi:transcriptional regulator with XRE-family HTH domain
MPRLFSAKLRHVRRLQKLTQSELAQYLFLASYTYINRLEADQRSPSLALVVRLAMLFDQRTDYFLRDTIPIEELQPSSIKPVSIEAQPMQLLGTKLRELRSQRGLSQTELTQRLVLSHPGHINNVEAGRRAPSMDLIIQIADLFEVTTDYLLLDTIPVTLVPMVPSSKPEVSET